jgi:DNA processing protein
MSPPSPPPAVPAEVRDLLALHHIDGLGPQRIAALLERFGTARRALEASATELREVDGIGKELSAALAGAGAIDVGPEVERIAREGVCLLARNQPGYPAWLASIPAAPWLLYVRGSIVPADERAVALVGTRHPTAYGRKVARTLAEGLAREGVTVVSGLARGIDGIAHQGALDAGGRTLAVLAGGLLRLYPPEHKELAAQVVGSGALVTESALGHEPLAGLFPARNRIISGLSRVVVIVQAPVKSGALITAERAGDQGRTVMAVPGPIDDQACEGCNRLIRDGAVLCGGVRDILEELDGVSAAAAAVQAEIRQVTAAPAGPPPGLDETQRKVWEALGEGPRSIDALARQLALGAGPLAVLLMGMQMKRLVRQLPGNRYERG